LRANNNQRVFYTTPIKALSNQKYRDFKREYGEENIGIMTGDVTINPGARIIVLTTEIYRNMLYNRADMDELEYIVFDEIHYFNDIFRGTVWEECLILSPPHVRMIMLSATAPNASVFANWLRTLRQEKIKVILEDYRHVPLKHYVYEGRIVPVEHVRVKKEKRKKRRRKKEKSNLGSGDHDVSTIGRDLLARDFLPALYVIFSKKKCVSAAIALAEEDFLLDEVGKKEIEENIAEFEQSITSADYQLDQLHIVLDCLRAGVCFHHAGLVPLLKEFIERLYSRALIKILFVTETFAVGVNMPARTVIFHSLVKFDGMKFRKLTSGEYIQLSGRAGRRGIDSVGHVLTIPNPPTKAEDIKTLLIGRPDDLTSQFNLSYSSIINHFASRTEEEILAILKKSFGQYLYQSAADRVYNNKRARMKELRAAIDGLTVRCELGCTNESVANYYHLERKLVREQQKSFRDTSHATRDDITRYNRNLKNYFERGRLVRLTGGGDGRKNLAIIVEIVKSKKRSRIPEIKVMTGNSEFKVLTLAGLSHGTSLFFPMTKRGKWPKRAAFNFIRQAAVDLTSKDLVPIRTVSEQLESFLQDKVEFQEFQERKTRNTSRYQQQLATHPVSSCPSLSKHLADLKMTISYQQQVNRVKSEIKEVKLIHSKDFRRKVKVLQRFKYLDGEKYLTDKGRMLANIFDEHELLIGECLHEGLFSGLDVDEVAALLGMFVYLSNNDPGVFFPRLENPRLKKVIRKVRRIHSIISNVERQERVEEATSQRLSFNTGFTQLVYLWSQGAELQELVDETNLPEGNIISSLRRLVDLIRQIGTATRTSPFDVGFDAPWVMDRVLRSHVKVELD
jgi:superfamily II RNA helicase